MSIPVAGGAKQPEQTFPDSDPRSDDALINAIAKGASPDLQKILAERRAARARGELA
jgi:hypothetical protein